MSVIVSFFEEKNQKIISLNMKLTPRGQVEYFTGELMPGIDNKEESEALEKKLSQGDFFNRLSIPSHGTFSNRKYIQHNQTLAL